MKSTKVQTLGGDACALAGEGFHVSKVDEDLAQMFFNLKIFH
jgi:hypothetical protein